MANWAIRGKLHSSNLRETGQLMLTYDATLNSANKTPKLNNKPTLNSANFFWPQTQICPDGAEKNVHALFEVAFMY